MSSFYNFMGSARVSSMMRKKHRYVYWKGADPVHIGALRRYAREKQELDKFLEKIIAPVISNRTLKILDAGCGVGHVPVLLHDVSPRSMFVGVDQTPLFIREGKKLYADKEFLSFEVGSVENLPKNYPKEFDVSVSRAVLSWIPYYEDFMRALVALTKKHIFVASLFYDGDIDFEIKIREYRKAAAKKGFTEYRNVYSLPRFKRFVAGLGARRVTVYDFEIQKDLPQPPKDQMGTYTVRLTDGKRLQISGMLLMNWKWIRIDL